MKFRTDFITNSSSGGFLSVTVGINNGEAIKKRWDDLINGDIKIDSMYLDKNTVLDIKSTDELINLLSLIYEEDYDEDDEDYKDYFYKRFGEFHEILCKKITDIKAISYIEVYKVKSLYGEFLHEVGEGDIDNIFSQDKYYRTIYDFNERNIKYNETIENE